MEEESIDEITNFIIQRELMLLNKKPLYGYVNFKTKEIHYEVVKGTKVVASKLNLKEIMQDYNNYVENME